MNNTKKYELKMFSSDLESNPTIKFEGLDMVFELKGYDGDGDYHECKIRFDSVIAYQYALVGFTVILDAYDKIVEMENSEWIEQYKKINPEEMAYWKPKHYAMYLDDIGLYQLLARGFEVEEK